MSKRLLDDLPDTTRRIAWIVFLTGASLAFSYVFACAAPFAALATLAALNLRRPDAFILTGLVWLANQAVGAQFPIAFKDMPKIRIVTTDPFVGTIEGGVDIATAVRLENGRLSLPSNFDLTSIENVQKETVAGLTSADVVRVEISHDWRAWRINPSSATSRSPTCSTRGPPRSRWASIDMRSARPSMRFRRARRS